MVTLKSYNQQRNFYRAQWEQPRGLGGILTVRSGGHD